MFQSALVSSGYASSNGKQKCHQMPQLKGRRARTKRKPAVPRQTTGPRTTVHAAQPETFWTFPKLRGRLVHLSVLEIPKRKPFQTPPRKTRMSNISSCSCTSEEKRKQQRMRFIKTYPQKCNPFTTCAHSSAAVATNSWPIF